MRNQFCSRDIEPLGRWAVGPLGRWAVGPLGRWAVGPLGRWAVGPLGRWAVGPLGRWAVGPLGRWAVGPLGRWAVGPLGRWAVGPLVLICAMIAGLASQAHAQDGEWVASYEVSGASSGAFGTVINSSTGPTIRESFSWDYLKGDYTDKPTDYTDYTAHPEYRGADNPTSLAGRYHVARKGYASAQADKTAANARAGGEIQVVWTWMPLNGDLAAHPVPATLNVLVTGVAEATACSKTNAAPEDRYPESGTVSVGIPGIEQQEDPDHSQQTRWFAKGSKLFQIETGGVTPIKSPALKFTLNAQSSIPDDRFSSVARPYGPPLVTNYPGNTSAGVDLRADEDNRSVKLTRNAKDRFELKDGKWITYGDTTYSYLKWHVDRYYNSYSTEVSNQVVIKADYLGRNWLGSNGTRNGSTDTPNGYYLDVKYKWDPSRPDELDAAGNGEDVVTYRQTMPLGGLEYQDDGFPTTDGDYWFNRNIDPTTYTINYTATDNGDGAVAQAQYVLTAHDPIETVGQDDAQIIHYVTDYFQDDGKLVTRSYPDTVAGTYSASTSHSEGWSLEGTVSPIKLFGEPLGVTAGYQSSHEEGFTDTAPGIVDAQGKEVPLQPDQTVYLRIRHTYNRHHVYFWKYNEAGKERRYSQGLPGENIEVPHEAIWDVFRSDSFTWSEPRTDGDERLPEPGDPQETIPEKSYKYSQRQEGKNAVG